MTSFLNPFRWLVPSNNTTGEGRGVNTLLSETECRILNPDIENHTIDFIFIHDAVPDHDNAWKQPDSEELWLTSLTHFPSARVFIYQYKRDWVRTIEDIVCPKRIRSLSRELLQFLGSNNHKSNVPLVVFAHGLGGLMYEQAFVWSVLDPDSDGSVLCNRRHVAFLFGTPHFGAGIAQWAIIVAKSYGIKCAKTAQAQDWSLVKNKIMETASMQRQFRDRLKGFGSAAIMTGCFSSLRDPINQLIISPEWAVLPEFMPIAINRSHSSMTRLYPEDTEFKVINELLQSVVRQLSRTGPKLTRNLTKGPARREPAEWLAGQYSANDGLAKRIADNLLESAVMPNRKFPPDGFQQILVTKETIAREIQNSNIGLAVDASVVDFIVERARRLFIIMVYCELDLRYIMLLLQKAQRDGFDDNLLPLRKFSPELRLFRHWNSTDLARFYEAQWTFLAPVFSSRRSSSKDFDENIILPLVSMDKQDTIDAFYETQLSRIDPSQLTQVEGLNRYEDVVLESVSPKCWSKRCMTMRVRLMTLPVNIVKRMVDFTVVLKSQDRDLDDSQLLQHHYIMFETCLDDY
ncbi:hypothetical protein F4825DRAFT_448428 [Nemania diffusa]|nr:hypothetical protein F4825DRAFT_448428 [Nemania diffusa]